MIASVREMEEQLRLQRCELEGRSLEKEKLEAVATLAGGIAHQFNNALMAIVGNLDLLQLDLPDNPLVTKYAGSMKSAVRRMTHLTDQLLAYARGGKYQPVVMPLNTVVERCLAEIQESPDPVIRFESHLGKDIPDVVADPVQMQMVLSALIENSREAMEGPGHVKVIARGQVVSLGAARTTVPPPGRYACLQVEDDGRGMDPETLNRVFEPFFTTKVMGRGLSMAAVYGIVKNHGGWILLDSEAGKGTVVRIYLPAAETRRLRVPSQHEEEAGGHADPVS